MNESEPPQTENACPISRKIGDRNAFLISHHDDFDGSPSANKNTYLTSDFVRKIGEEAGKLKGKNLLWGDSPSINMFDLLKLIRF
jgi:hypothetical protein